MRREDLLKKEIYANERTVNITEEGPKEDLLNLERPSLDSSVALSVVPPEERIDRFRDKEDEETPLSILPSGSHGITVTEADIATLCCEGVAVGDGNKKTCP